MVTVTVAEDEGAVSELLHQFLLKKKICVTKKTIRTGLFCLSFDTNPQSDCNILLLHAPCNLPEAKCDIVLLHTDRKITLPTGKKPLVVTYGLNPLATVTASSLDKHRKTRMVCCLQRSIVTLFGKVVEPQEFSASIPGAESTAISFVTLGLLLGFSPDELKNPFNLL